MSPFGSINLLSLAIQHDSAARADMTGWMAAVRFRGHHRDQRLL